MAAVRITLSVPDELAARIKAAAGSGTVSGWIVKIIKEYLAEDAELERRFDEWLEANPPSEEATQRADELFEHLFRRGGQGQGAA